MTKIILLLGLLSSFFLQINFLRSFSIFGATSNLVLIFLIYVSIYRKWREALSLALLGGLLLDLLCEPFGLNLLFFLVVTFIIVLFKRKTNLETLPYIFIFTIGFSLTYNFIWAVVLYFRRLPLDSTFFKTIVSQDIQTVIFVLILHYLFVRFFERIKLKEKR